jgi:hypothetical protein
MASLSCFIGFFLFLKFITRYQFTRTVTRNKILFIRPLADHKLTSSKIATRLPESIFDDLIRHTQLVMEERNMAFFHTLTSHRCPKSGKEHGYYGPHRCFRCDTQLCKVSSILGAPFLPQIWLSVQLRLSTLRNLNHRKDIDKIQP